MNTPTEVTPQAIEDAVRALSRQHHGDPLESRLRAIADLYRRRASVVGDIVAGNDHVEPNRKIDGIWFDRWGIVVGVTVGGVNWVDGKIVEGTPPGRIYDCNRGECRSLDLLARWAEWSCDNYLFTRRIYTREPVIPKRDPHDNAPGTLPDEISRLVEFAKRDAEAELEQRGEL